MRLFALLALLASSSAAALPPIGAALPQVVVKPAEGPEQKLPVDGRPVLIFYESKASRPQNYPFKQRLKGIAATHEEYRTRLALIPIANLQSYDFWPIRGIAAHAVRSEAKRVGRPIYCDWNGEVAKVLGARREMSSVILVDHTGRVLFAAEGPLAPADQDKLLELLRVELAG